MNRLEVLAEIDKLNDNYKNLSKKEQKEADKRIAELGNMLSSVSRSNKINEIVVKGKDATRSDIQYLQNRC